MAFAVASITTVPDAADARGLKRLKAPFRLLQFTGAPMKWGGAQLGRSASVTWRLAAEAERFTGARNCRAVTPIENALAPSAIDRATFYRELLAAMDMWQRVAGITFRRAENGERADLVIGAQARPRGRAYTNVSAHRMLPVSAPNKAVAKRVDRLQEAVICLNPRQPWKVGFDGDLEVYDLRHTLAHELGHVIGLDHSGPRGAVMAFRYDEKHRELSPGDVAGAQRLYGLPRTLVAGGAGEPKSLTLPAGIVRTGRALKP